MAGKKVADRPYRIYDEDARRDIPHRAYVRLDRAIERALGQIYWMEVGNSWTVYHEPSSKAIVQITNGPDGFKFYYDHERVRKWLQSVSPQKESVKVPGVLFHRR